MDKGTYGFVLSDQKYLLYKDLYKKVAYARRFQIDKIDKDYKIFSDYYYPDDMKVAVCHVILNNEDIDINDLIYLLKYSTQVYFNQSLKHFKADDIKKIAESMDEVVELIMDEDDKETWYNLLKYLKLNKCMRLIFYYLNFDDKMIELFSSNWLKRYPKIESIQFIPDRSSFDTYMLKFPLGLIKFYFDDWIHVAKWLEKSKSRGENMVRVKHIEHIIGSCLDSIVDDIKVLEV